MKKRMLSLLIGLSAAIALSATVVMASESARFNTGEPALSGTGTKVAYRYYYPGTGCYYVRKCVRVNRWGQCIKVRWIKKCGPRRVL